MTPAERLRSLEWRPWLVAAGGAAAAAFVGLHAGDAYLLGALAFVAGASWLLFGHPAPASWPQAMDPAAQGTRHDVDSLRWALAGHEGRVREEAVRRVRDLAAHRLTRLGHPVQFPDGVPQADHPWHVDRARWLLGEHAWTTLTTPRGAMPRLPDVAACLDRLEQLAAGPASPVGHAPAHALVPPPRPAPLGRPLP